MMVFGCRQGHVQVITTECLTCADLGKMMLQSPLIGFVIWNQSARTANTKLRHAHHDKSSSEMWFESLRFLRQTFIPGQAGQTQVSAQNCK